VNFLVIQMNTSKDISFQFFGSINERGNLRVLHSLISPHYVQKKIKKKYLQIYNMLTVQNKRETHRLIPSCEFSRKIFELSQARNVFIALTRYDRPTDVLPLEHRSILFDLPAHAPSSINARCHFDRSIHRSRQARFSVHSSIAVAAAAL
jgi:hypothetical protein